MPVTIEASGSIFQADRRPDECPLCHSKIIPHPVFLGGGGRVYKADIIVAYKCPNMECRETFIAYFSGTDPSNGKRREDLRFLMGTRPTEPSSEEFAVIIKKISPSFCNIYDESYKAETFGLTQICGVGYRKALEFLIKDYLIINRPGDKANIEATMLGLCIENYVTDPRVKEISKRATWLANDETHYKRRWIDKDLGDLKILIRLTLHWIEAEHLTGETLKSMPTPSKP